MIKPLRLSKNPTYFSYQFSIAIIIPFVLNSSFIFTTGQIIYQKHHSLVNLSHHHIA